MPCSFVLAMIRALIRAITARVLGSRGCAVAYISVQYSSQEISAKKNELYLNVYRDFQVVHVKPQK